MSGFVFILIDGSREIGIGATPQEAWATIANGRSAWPIDYYLPIGVGPIW